MSKPEDKIPGQVNFFQRFAGLLPEIEEKLA